MIGHLGARVSALLDGQLPPEEAERAWEHVHQCHACRDLVEREGWIKTRLAGLTFGATEAPGHLKGSLLGSPALPTPLDTHRTRRNAGLVALGGGAVGAAVVGVLALGVASPDGPVDRRPPATNIRQSDPPRTIPVSPVRPTSSTSRFAGR